MVRSITGGLLQIKEGSLQVEEYDVFRVTQLTRDTELEHLVACDFVRVEPGRESEIHRHNNAETILYILDGEGEVYHNGVWLRVKRRDRVRIGKGVWHGVRTGMKAITFISVQSPPILDKSSGTLDLELLKKEE